MFGVRFRTYLQEPCVDFFLVVCFDTSTYYDGSHVGGRCSVHSPCRYHLVINLCILGLVPAALCFALFVKVVRIQTRAHDSGPWHLLARYLRVKTTCAAEPRYAEETFRPQQPTVLANA